jgi:sulfite reductase (ferredoxin)
MPDLPTVTPAPASPIAKETKAQKMERLKVEKNPWDAWDEVRRFAAEGRESVLPEWAGAYFKWWGIYTQGDGKGVTGGSGGEGKATEYFMMRIGMPNGMLTAEQTHVIADLTKKYAQNLCDITTRQNIQLHWLTIQGLVDVTDALEKVGLSPKGACGDVVRNVTGCPIAGIDGHELLDCSPLARDVAQKLTANPEFYNLPRKFKITISGCPLWCTYPEINDVALNAIAREKDGQREIGYSLRVGGGLSAEPHLAVRIPVFVPQDRAYDVIRTIVEIFRDQQELRENRTRARLKYLFLRHGWTAETMKAEIERRMGYTFDHAPAETVPQDIYRDHVGVTPQRQPGLSAVGATVLRGRLSGDQLEALATLSEKYADGQLRATIMQNILIVNVPNENVQKLIEELHAIDLVVEASPFWRGAIACTGTEFCKLAIAETKGFTKWLVGELEERMPTFDQQIKLHVTGCTNSCGQHWIADIGLEGKKLKKDGQSVDAFYFCVGGGLNEHARTARPLGFRAAAEDCPDAIVRMLQAYESTRDPGETLRSYFNRTSDDDLRAQLNGTVIDPVERDLAPAGGRHVSD